ncbi:MAG: hypothetical protein SCARUB_05228, partial [Candidatus Scalindua rubra]
KFYLISNYFLTYNKQNFLYRDCPIICYLSYPTPNHISPVISLYILMFKFPLAMYFAVNIMSLISTIDLALTDESYKVSFYVIAQYQVEFHAVWREYKPRFRRDSRS